MKNTKAEENTKSFIPRIIATYGAQISGPVGE
jgi:flagellar biosynthesis protein FliQ